MTSGDIQMQRQQQGYSAPNPVGPGQQQSQGLPPTGMQQQMTSLNSFYQQVQGAQGIGFDPRQQQLQQSQEMNAPVTGMGQTSLQQLGDQLAQRYGLPIGRGSLFDAQGNPMMTPDQLANASGGETTMGEAAAKMNYISQAIAREQNRQRQQSGIAALQTGLGQVQSRGRGSLASMMSGMYQSLADMYANPEFTDEAKDFSYYIEKEKMDIAQELQRRQEKLQKKQARMQVFTGIAGAIGGFASGNVGMGIGGLGQAAGGAAGSGWF